MSAAIELFLEGAAAAITLYLSYRLPNHHRRK